MAEEGNNEEPLAPIDYSLFGLEQFDDNPIYRNIGLLDHDIPSPQFNYRWNIKSSRWEPMSRDSEDILTHQLLSGVREDLKRIEIDVEIDSDTQAHYFLSGIIDMVQEEGSQTQSLLSDIHATLFSKNTTTHDLLQGIDDQIASQGQETQKTVSDLDETLRENSLETHGLLSGVINQIIEEGNQSQILLQPLENQLTENNDHQKYSHNLLSGIKQELESIHVDVEIDSDTHAHSLLSGVINTVTQESDETQDILRESTGNQRHSHELLSGIKQELESIHVDVEIDSDTHAHSLLSGVINTVTQESDETQDILRESTGNQRHSHELLSGIKQELESIHVDVEIDSDTHAHSLLSGVINTVTQESDETQDILRESTGNQRHSHELLSGIKQELESIHVDVEIDSDTHAHSLLSGVINTVTQESDETQDILRESTGNQRHSHELLSGIKQELESIHVDVEIDSDTHAHSLLSGVINTVTQESDETQDILRESTGNQRHSHELLSGIKQELESIHVDVEIDSDTHAHSLLSGVINTVTQESDETQDILRESTGNQRHSHELLSGIKQELESIHVDVEIDSDTHAHSLLSGVINTVTQESDETQDILRESTSNQRHSHELLSGIKQELESIHVDVEIDSDTHAHSLLSGVINTVTQESDETQDILRESTGNQRHSHELLSGIKQELELIQEINNDQKTHALLSGVINTLSNESDQSQIILEEISDKLVGENSDKHILSGIHEELQSLRDDFYKKSETQTISQEITEDFILLESISDEDRYGPQQELCYGQNIDIKDEIFQSYFPNSRRSPLEPEKNHPDFFIHAENANQNRCTQQYSTFHTDTDIALRFENPQHSQGNYYKLDKYSDLFNNQGVESVTIFNESNYPMYFHCGDYMNKETEPHPIKLNAEMGVRLSHNEASEIYVKRPFTISGFNIKYAVTYKTR